MTSSGQGCLHTCLKKVFTTLPPNEHAARTARECELGQPDAEGPKARSRRLLEKRDGNTIRTGGLVRTAVIVFTGLPPNEHAARQRGSANWSSRMRKGRRPEADGFWTPNPSFKPESSKIQRLLDADCLFKRESSKIQRLLDADCLFKPESSEIQRLLDADRLFKLESSKFQRLLDAKPLF